MTTLEQAVERDWHPTQSEHPGTRAALASTLTLQPGWYWRRRLAEVIAASSGVTVGWAEDLLKFASDDGVIVTQVLELTDVSYGPGRKLKAVRRTHVYVDPAAVRNAWGIDPAWCVGEPLPINPVLPAVRTRESPVEGLREL